MCWSKWTHFNSFYLWHGFYLARKLIRYKWLERFLCHKLEKYRETHQNIKFLYIFVRYFTNSIQFHLSDIVSNIIFQSFFSAYFFFKLNHLVGFNLFRMEINFHWWSNQLWICVEPFDGLCSITKASMLLTLPILPE